MSPSDRCKGGIEPSNSSAQQPPEVTAWNIMTCSATGMTEPAIFAAAGVVAAQGALAFTSKNTAPLSRTERSTSDSMSTHPPTKFPTNMRTTDQIHADE